MVASAAPPGTTAPPAAPPGDAAVTDPQLVEAIEEARDRQRPGAPEPTVSVELLLGDEVGAAAAARAEVRAAGGRVTGELPGVVVQAVVPVSEVGTVAATAAVDVARAPRRVNRLEDRLPVEGFGATQGAQVAATNADAWLGRGSLPGTGVGVGVIDFFDMAYWFDSELGPRPTVANGRLFCRDTTGFVPSACVGDDLNPSGGDTHGNAVVEIVKDMAPGAEIFIATAGTVSDTRAAIDWFASKGVNVITRSLGAAYDGAGDGTGPLAELVDYAASKGIVWFNSAGNDATGRYARFNVPTSLPIGGYVNVALFDNTLGIAPEQGCVWLDGLRWDDWYTPIDQRVSYQIELWQGTASTPLDLIGVDPTSPQIGPGIQPLIATDAFECLDPGFSYFHVRVRKLGGYVGPGNDVLEIGTTSGIIEYAQSAYSAAKPVVDSRNPLLLAVGAIDPPTGTAIGFYSSQGPTNDCRPKPDISAPSGVFSYVFSQETPGNATFSGTSAASPAAAGAAAVLVWAGLAQPGTDLAAKMRAYTLDYGAAGFDNAFGIGAVQLPEPFTPGAPGSISSGTASRTAVRMPLGC
jgi:hypothetical protein